jgi:hypothetical protein
MKQNFFTPQLARFPVNENVIPGRWSNKPHRKNVNERSECFVHKPSRFQEW